MLYPLELEPAPRVLGVPERRAFDPLERLDCGSACSYTVFFFRVVKIAKFIEE
ncbi:MAG: hypothetical protein M3N93_06750 [Acidobacteriota bacterium]|nr:hypothetical protein [Acidobacteriota bacterium]